MIEAKDLRVGNWLEGHFGTCFQVDGQVLYWMDIGLEKEVTREYKPITLTSEIMVNNCGFTKRKNSTKYWSHFILPNGWHISQWVAHENVAGFEKNGTFYWGEHYVPVKYLHKLQNLYYALTENDFPIKL